MCTCFFIWFGFRKESYRIADYIKKHFYLKTEKLIHSTAMKNVFTNAGNAPGKNRNSKKSSLQLNHR